MASQDGMSSQEVFSANLTRRGFAKGAAGFGGALGIGALLAACGVSAEPASSGSAAAPKYGGTLRVGMVGGSAKDTLDPNLAYTQADQAFQYCIAEGLLGFSPALKIENRLAEAVTPNADASVWTVRLKSDLVWHNGSPITSDDVVYTLQRITDPKKPLEGAATLRGLNPSGISKVDERTVKLTLTEPNALLSEGLANRTCMLVPVGFDAKNPVLCGPFKVKTFTPGDRAVLEPFKEFWRGSPYVDELHLIEFADPAARVNALLSGNVDMISELPPGQQKVVTTGGKHVVLTAKSGAWLPFCMRIDQKPFDDLRVRQAFRLMVDRPQVVQNAYTNIGWLGNDMYGRFDPGYPADLPQRAVDVAKARSLLKQAGYDNNLTVTLNTSDDVSPRAVTSALVFAEQAKAAGVTVIVNNIGGGAYYGDDYLSYAFSMDTWNARGYLLQALQGSVPGALYNETHWEDAEWNALVQEALKTGDEAKRNELVAQAAAIEYDRGGYIIPAFVNTLDVHSSKLGGVIQNDASGVPLAAYRLNTVYFI